MPPAEATPVNWTAIGVIVVTIISISGWFIVHILTKRREAQRDQRARDEAAAAKQQALQEAMYLTDAEREILHQCIALDGFEKGHVWILHVDAFGSWVRAGKHDFFDQADPSIQARYIDAFESLNGRGYFRHEGGMLYQLTGPGFERARHDTKNGAAPNSRAALPLDL